MAASTVPVDKNDNHSEESHRVESTGHETAATGAHSTHASTAGSSLPQVNVWEARKEAMKPSALNAEAEAEKRVEGLIENIKGVTLGKSSALCNSASSHPAVGGLICSRIDRWNKDLFH